MKTTRDNRFSDPRLDESFKIGYAKGVYSWEDQADTSLSASAGEVTTSGDKSASAWLSGFFAGRASRNFRGD